MMLVEWGSSRARIWLGESPNWQTPQPEVTVRRLVTEASGIGESRNAAVEILLFGPKNRYGALGATFVPGADQTLVMRVLHSTTMGAPFVESLAAHIDVVHQGLLTEYVPGILDNTTVSAAASSLGPGVLSFSSAAHGEIGSSMRDFGLLARIIVALLLRMPTSEADVVAILRAEIVGTSSLH